MQSRFGGMARRLGWRGGHTCFSMTERLEERQLLAAVPQVVWSSYFGGADTDVANAIAVDASGNTYVAGITSSSGWVRGGQDTSYGGWGDGFIAKINADGSLAWASYLGGGGEDVASSLAVDRRGNVYVAGWTHSRGWVSGGLTSTLSSYTDAFVAKIRPDGSVVWSGYLGTGNSSEARAIAVSSSGDVYVAGDMAGVTTDAFVARIDNNGTLQWLKRLGGNDYDYAQALAVDDSGDVVVAGGTYSAGWTVGGFDTTRDGFSDGFAARLDQDGRLIWSSYIGGSSYDYAHALVLGHAGDIYVAGVTGSVGWVSGGSDVTHNGSDDPFAARLRMDGTLVWSTYLGGPNADGASAIAIDSHDDLYIAGTVHPINVSDSDYHGHDQGYVAAISPDGTVGWMTSVGHSGYNRTNGVAVDDAGAIYVAGQAYYSGDALVPRRDGINAYVLKLVALEVRGTEGADTIRVEASGTQYIVTVNGQSTVYEQDQVVSLSVYGMGGDDTITISSGVALGVSVYGGAGNDLIVGGSGSDLIEGGEGDDTLSGGAGDDTIYGHDGADRLEGGVGDDELYGNAGNDSVNGGDGNDVVFGQGGDDVLYGNLGDDTLNGGDGADELRAGLGADRMLGGIGNDSLFGGDGSDTISGDEGDDYIEARGKADTVYGGSGNDTIWGGAGSDWIDAGDGNDWIDTGPANALFRDSVYGGAGEDTVRGNAGDLLEAVEVSVIG